MFDKKMNWMVKFNTPLRIIILAFAFFCLIFLIYSYFSKESVLPRVYRIAYDETWNPLELYDKEQDLSAFSEEIILAIAKDKHFSVELLRVSSDDLLEGLERGNYEGVLSSPTLDQEESGNFLFSDPYYFLGPVLVVLKSSPIETLQDLKGKSIGTITSYKNILSLDKFPSINFVYYDYYNRPNLIEDVNNQVIDGMILLMITANEYTKKGLYQDELKIISAPLNDDGLRLTTKKNKEYKKLIEEFNEGLKEIKKKGIYSRILLKWDLFDSEKYERPTKKLISN